jgi:broad specificity polyphosphatase/5'/3'-nucleotidase SurE
LSGDPTEVERSEAFDTRAVISGYITITPLQLDATAPEGLGLGINTDNILKNKENI